MSQPLPLPAPALLEARQLGFAYPGQPTTFQQVSLQIRPREIVALLGGSGCGKSSLLRVLAGLAQPSAGEVRFLDQPLQQPHPRSALIFQQASLLPWLRVFDNASFGLDFKHQPKLDQATRHQRVSEALAAVGLQGREQARPSELSGGQAQRVALARALAKQPELLFADEPFSALDAITRAEMQQLLVDLVHRWHTAVLLVTHDLDEALQVADRILLMGQSPGRLIQEWVVNQPHPREGINEPLGSLRHEILQALHQSTTSNSPLEEHHHA